ncbi:hypothetical protein PAXRUDRAFT_829483 [Paxillus rubicundulus Ve08.2h10]|uniref:Uncharacterized protein n=1 Tax=Paxillus rubicundulus Ve08.2h10 TaxID=930991 RepID=A0A0D0E5Z3_9AGAM|nr:hypothetical protein PAXRUDRAFT_829483 [Paxillus rubicundulus Ve08.2h10]
MMNICHIYSTRPRNRVPNGRPDDPESGIHNAQDPARLAGLKYARKNVFIQSPTFNAVPVMEGVLNAVRRGIECTLYIDVGFNDGGEVLPGQGGIKRRSLQADVCSAQRSRETETKVLLVHWRVIALS